MSKFWDWMTTEEKVIKPLPSRPGFNDYYDIPRRDRNGPTLVSDHTEKQLQEMYPPLKDAYEQYQILLKMYDNKHKTKFQKARSV